MPRRYGNSRAIWDHTVSHSVRPTCHPAEVKLSAVTPSQLKLVLDLATPEKRKAKLT